MESKSTSQTLKKNLLSKQWSILQSYTSCIKHFFLESKSRDYLNELYLLIVEAFQNKDPLGYALLRAFLLESINSLLFVLHCYEHFEDRPQLKREDEILIHLMEGFANLNIKPPPLPLTSPAWYWTLRSSLYLGKLSESDLDSVQQLLLECLNVEWLEIWLKKLRKKDPTFAWLKELVSCSTTFKTLFEPLCASLFEKLLSEENEREEFRLFLLKQFNTKVIFYQQALTTSLSPLEKSVPLTWEELSNPNALWNQPQRTDTPPGEHTLTIPLGLEHFLSTWKNVNDLHTISPDVLYAPPLHKKRKRGEISSLPSLGYQQAMAHFTEGMDPEGIL